ncbi:hypothetical protein ACFL46_02050 [Candidatus Neomarinimicrobiota bacterium]
MIKTNEKRRLIAGKKESGNTHPIPFFPPLFGWKCTEIIVFISYPKNGGFRDIY